MTHIDTGPFTRLVSCSDFEFERAVQNLDIRGLIELVSRLQNEMAVEQNHFDELSRQLQMANHAVQHQHISAALCICQARLAQLCSRNMKCFMQQAVRAREQQAALAGSKAPNGGRSAAFGARSDTEDDEDSERPANSRTDTRRSGFRENLLFFELQAKMNRPPPGGGTAVDAYWNSTLDYNPVQRPKHSSGSQTLPRPGKSTDSSWSALGAQSTATTSNNVEASSSTSSVSPPPQDEDDSGYEGLSGSWKRQTINTKNKLSLLDQEQDRSWDKFSSLPRHQRLHSARSSEHLDDVSSDQTPLKGRIVRTWSLGEGLDWGATKSTPVRRAPSVEEILQSVKDLRMRQAAAGAADDEEEHVYENISEVVGPTPTMARDPIYENVVPKNNAEPIYQNSVDAEPLYDLPRGTCCPPPAESIVPAATQLILQMKKEESVSSDGDFDGDGDSLEEEEPRARAGGPDIPSPDYGSEEEDEDDAAYGVYDDLSVDYADSGIESSDGGRSTTYYPDDTGLEVIVEEEEEELENEEFEEMEMRLNGGNLPYTRHIRNRTINGYPEDEEFSDDSHQGRNSGAETPDGSTFRRGSAVSCPDKFDLPDSAVDDLSSLDGRLLSPDPTTASDGGSQLLTPEDLQDVSECLRVTSPDSSQLKDEPSDHSAYPQSKSYAHTLPLNCNHCPTPPEVLVTPPPPDSPPPDLKAPVNGDCSNLYESSNRISETLRNGQSSPLANGNCNDINNSESKDILSDTLVNNLVNKRSYTNGNMNSHSDEILSQESKDQEAEEKNTKRYLPSVKALRSQFEVKQNGTSSLPSTIRRSSFSDKVKTKSNEYMEAWNSSSSVTIDKITNDFGPIEPRKSRSRSMKGQSEKSIPELLRSLGGPDSSYDGQNGTVHLRQKKSSSMDSGTYKRNDLNGTVRTVKPIFSPEPPVSPDDVIPSIIAQFSNEIAFAVSKTRATTYQWDPTLLLQELYNVPIPKPDYAPDASATFINIEGYLEKLPSGRKKATFWNAWKRRYFRLKDGYLHYYQNNHSEKPSLTLNLMGGHIDCMDTTMIGIDDGKGHYVVVRCNSKHDAERWVTALLTHTAEKFSLTYTQPVIAYPHFYEDVIIIDLGSCSVRAGILCNQPTLPQLFFPTVCNTNRDTGKKIFGIEALTPANRVNATLSFPLKPSAKITKYSVDLEAVQGLLAKVFSELNVDPRKFQIQLSLPRSFTVRTQTEVLKMLLEEFSVKAVNLTNQNVLSLLSYNATSGIVVDIGERMEVIPIIDGYIVEPGVSRIPYGGTRIVDHLRHFLLQRHYSLVSDIESYLVRYVLEKSCYCAEQYNLELQKYIMEPEMFEKSIEIHQFFDKGEAPWDEIALDNGRFQAPEGLFNPDAWGLDNPGVHKLVHKAIQECSLDIRKEMTRSIYLSGGITMIPGFAQRLELEVDKLTPPSLSPKVHCSPYRYHAAYLGACVLSGSSAFKEARITKEDWLRDGVNCLKKWHL